MAKIPLLNNRFLNGVLFFSIMVRGNLRSKTYRRVYVTTPGGREVIHYKRRAPAKPKCSECQRENIGGDLETRVCHRCRDSVKEYVFIPSEEETTLPNTETNLYN